MDRVDTQQIEVAGGGTVTLAGTDAMYEDDLAYIHAAGFSAYARGAAVEIIRRLKAASLTVEHVVDAGDDGDTDAFIGAAGAACGSSDKGRGCGSRGHELCLRFVPSSKGRCD